MSAFSGNALWQLVVQSDAISKLVLLILLFMSIASWTIFLYKFILLRIKKRQMKKAVRNIADGASLEDLLNLSSALANTLPGYFLSKNLTFLKSVLEHSGSQGSMLSQQEVDVVQQHAYQTVDSLVHHEESYLSMLSTTAAVSPLLGLFGTVWGLVHAFIRISQQQQADIATVAPGIAEALITTLAGLVVAIPALMLFNYLANHMRTLEQQMLNLADKFCFVVQKLLAR